MQGAQGWGLQTWRPETRIYSGCYEGVGSRLDEMQDDHLLKHFSSEVLVTWTEVVLAGMSSKYIHVLFRKI